MNIQEKINQLSDREFENLTFDLAAHMGFRNLVWRTPGSDGGRDIEAVILSTDVTGQTVTEKWFIECKRYKSSVSWPTLWEKIAHADALVADFLLLATNSNPSPMCEERINEWNRSGRRPKIRVFRGYDFPRLLRPFPSIVASYGLSSDVNDLERSLLPVSLMGQKISDSALLGASLGKSVLIELEAASSINELVVTRLNDISRYGKFVKNYSITDSVVPDWICGISNMPDWDEPGLRAIISCFRFFTFCSKINGNFQDGVLRLEAENARCKINCTTSRNISQLQAFSFCEINQFWEDGVITVEGR